MEFDEALKNQQDPTTGTGIPCAVCGQPLPARTTEWEGQPVHVVCPGVDYTCISKDMRGVYAHHPEVSLEELEEVAAVYGLTPTPYSDEQGSTNEQGWPLFMVE